jgi:hypothetical protein
MNSSPDEDINGAADTDSSYSVRTSRLKHSNEDRRNSLFCSDSRSLSPVQAMDENIWTTDRKERSPHLVERPNSDIVSNNSTQLREQGDLEISSETDEKEDSDHPESDTDNAIAM